MSEWEHCRARSQCHCLLFEWTVVAINRGFWFLFFWAIAVSLVVVNREFFILLICIAICCETHCHLNFIWPLLLECALARASQNYDTPSRPKILQFYIPRHSQQQNKFSPKSPDDACNQRDVLGLKLDSSLTTKWSADADNIHKRHAELIRHAWRARKRFIKIERWHQTQKEIREIQQIR
jgi:hypothetical protein